MGHSEEPGRGISKSIHTQGIWAFLLNYKNDARFVSFVYQWDFQGPMILPNYGKLPILVPIRIPKDMGIV